MAKLYSINVDLLKQAVIYYDSFKIDFFYATVGKFCTLTTSLQIYKYIKEFFFFINGLSIIEMSTHLSNSNFYRFRD